MYNKGLHIILTLQFYISGIIHEANKKTTLKRQQTKCININFQVKFYMEWFVQFLALNQEHYDLE